jgi:hypothetical protein
MTQVPTGLFPESLRAEICGLLCCKYDCRASGAIPVLLGCRGPCGPHLESPGSGSAVLTAYRSRQPGYRVRVLVRVVGSGALCDRWLGPEDSEFKFAYLLLAKAAFGYHPFGQPRNKFPEPLLGRVTEAAGAVPRGPTECNATEDFLGCVWHVPAGPVWSSRWSAYHMTGPYWSDSKFKFAHISLVHDWSGSKL